MTRERVTKLPKFFSGGVHNDPSRVDSVLKEKNVSHPSSFSAKPQTGEAKTTISLTCTSL